MGFFVRNFGIAYRVLKVIITGLLGVSARTHLLFVYNCFYKWELYNNNMIEAREFAIK
jgi:hypothetical protein